MKIFSIDIIEKCIIFSFEKIKAFYVFSETDIKSGSQTLQAFF